jgi:hypothetical protein
MIDEYLLSVQQYLLRFAALRKRLINYLDRKRSSMRLHPPSTVVFGTSVGAF